MNKCEAIVLFSGGQDSTTCLGWSLEKFESVRTLGFRYGQRHSIELDCRQKILDTIKVHYPRWKEKLKEDIVIDLDFIPSLGANALTEESAIKMNSRGLPTTFVPGRNIFFLSVGGALAYRQNIVNIVGGMCETDFSGYPDCRDETIKSLEKTLTLGMNWQLQIHTPLMWLDKGQIWHLARTLGGDKFVDLIVEQTHTCYRGKREKLHEWGYGCSDCPACELRSVGYREFKKQKNRESK